jgi:hypothetical protein
MYDLPYRVDTSQRLSIAKRNTARIWTGGRGPGLKRLLSVIKVGQRDEIVNARFDRADWVGSIGQEGDLLAGPDSLLTIGCQVEPFVVSWLSLS